MRGTFPSFTTVHPMMEPPNAMAAYEDRQIEPRQESERQFHFASSISGGVFEGAHVGPQNINLHRKDHVVENDLQNANFGRMSHTTIQDSTIHITQQNQTEEPSTEHGNQQEQTTIKRPFQRKGTDWMELSGTIRMFYNRHLGGRQNIFRGEQPSKITGPRPLAIKSLPYNEENIREAKTLHKLSHPNIVSIVHSDVYFQGPIKYMYIAMEMCHTQNLYQHVLENKRNSVGFNARLSIAHGRQITLGIEHIHENNIIHRNLKPHNILFSICKRFLKIADFGFSTDADGRHSTEAADLPPGANGYRAPETYNRDITSRQADVFSLGLVLFFLWSNGWHPFGDDPDDWNSNIKRNRNRSFHRLLITRTELAKDLLEKTLAYNPAVRPTSTDILTHTIFDSENLAERELPERLECATINRSQGEGETTTPKGLWRTSAAASLVQSHQLGSTERVSTQDGSFRLTFTQSRIEVLIAIKKALVDTQCEVREVGRSSLSCKRRCDFSGGMTEWEVAVCDALWPLGCRVIFKRISDDEAAFQRIALSISKDLEKRLREDSPTSAEELGKC